MSCLRSRSTALMERYLRDELPEAELEAFEIHVLECDDCAEELEHLAALRAELARRREEIEGEWKSARPSSWRVWLALAAVLIVALGLVVLRRPGESELAAIASIEPPVYREIRLRGAMTETDQQFRVAMERYNRGDFRGAVRGLEAALDEDPINLDALFWLGASRLLAGEPQAAEGSLSRVVAVGDTPYLEEALNLRAQAYLLLGDAGAAATDLEAILELDGDWAERARVQLEKLEALSKADS